MQLLQNLTFINQKTLLFDAQRTQAHAGSSTVAAVLFAGVLALSDVVVDLWLAAADCSADYLLLPLFFGLASKSGSIIGGIRCSCFACTRLLLL